MKHLLIVLLYFFCSLASFAQTTNKNYKMKSYNAVYIDAPTLNTIVTVNYDRILYDVKWFKWSARIGVGSNFHYQTDINIPVETSLLIGKGAHYGEIGVGMASYFLKSKQFIAEWNEDKIQEYWLSSRLGYRLQTKHFILRVAYTPYWLLHGGRGYYRALDSFQSGPSLSVGYAF